MNFPLPLTVGLPINHFLALPRPDRGLAAVGTPDTSTLAAHDFDVDTRTGFMPPQAPIARLPEEWEPWEAALDAARSNRLQLAEKRGPSVDDLNRSERWRQSIRELPIIAIDNLKGSEILLRRAHHVLTWVMHFYIHTLPLSIPELHIPPPITLPLLQVSAQLQLPPILTYSDNVLYNWEYITAPPTFPPRPIAPDNIRSQTLFTGTRDEEEFYLASSRIELRGVEALTLMRAMMDEAFLGDATAIRRITGYLHALAGVISALTTILGNAREGCDPDVFYNEVRPWFCGVDSGKRKWVFEGLECDPTLHYPAELSGPSAGQSALIHALDVFLGVDRYSHSNFMAAKPVHMARAQTAPSAPQASASTSASLVTFSSAPSSTDVPFLTRMQSYMPRHHRAFLSHLSTNPRPLRMLVENAGDRSLLEAYNVAVSALKVFRDEHVKIVALYILLPSKKAQDAAGVGKSAGVPKGTGGTDAFQFVKGVRDQTAGAILKSAE